MVTICTHCLLYLWKWSLSFGGLHNLSEAYTKWKRLHLKPLCYSTLWRSEDIQQMDDWDATDRHIKAQIEWDFFLQVAWIIFYNMVINIVCFSKQNRVKLKITLLWDGHLLV